MSEEGLPWYTKEDTSLIVERKTDTQTYTFEKETILNTKTKPTEEVPELYTLSSGSISEVVSPLEQKIGNYFKLKDLISYDYNNPLYYELNNYPGIDKKYNGEEIVQNLKDLMEKLIMDKNSPLYDVPDGMVAGKDWRQVILLKYVHAAEKLAYAEMYKEYPIIERTVKERGAFTIFKFDENKIGKKKKSYFK